MYANIEDKSRNEIEHDIPCKIEFYENRFMVYFYDSNEYRYKVSLSIKDLKDMVDRYFDYNI